MSAEVDDDRRRALAIATALFLLSAAFLLTRTARDALYMASGGIYALPGAYLGIAALAVPCAFVMLGLIRRFGARRVRVATAMVVALALVVFALLARPGGGRLMTAFFVLLPLLFSVAFSATWLLCSDLLEGTPRDRLASAYGRASAGAILGSFVGALAARIAGDRVDPRVFIWMAAAVTAAAGGVVAAAHHAFPTRLAKGPPPGSPEPLLPLSLLRARYPMLLLLVAMSGSLVGVLLEFQLYLAAASAGGDARANARFFSTVYAVLNGVALVTQLVVAAPLQRAIGVGGSLLVLPSTLLFGVLLGGASLFARSALRVMDGGLRASIHRVSWEQAYLPLGSAQRAAAKVLVEGAGARVAEAAVALLLLVWLVVVVGEGTVVGRDTSWITALLLLALACWLVLTRLLGARMSEALGDGPLPAGLSIAVPPPDS